MDCGQIFHPITTKRLNLRKLAPEDAGALFAYRSLREVYRYQSFQPSGREEAIDFIENTAQTPDIPDTWFQLAVCLKDTGLMIGDVGIHFLQGRAQAEIGYTIAPEHQGRGYALESVRAVISYLFTVLGKHRVIASVDPLNVRSVALLYKLGMRKEAHFVKSVQTNGVWTDDCVFAILNEEWNA